MLINESKIIDTRIRISLLEIAAFCLRMTARLQSDTIDNFTVKLTPEQRESEAKRYMGEYEFFYENAKKLE